MRFFRLLMIATCLVTLSCGKEIKQEQPIFSSSLSDDVSLCKEGEQKVALFSKFPHRLAAVHAIQIRDSSSDAFKKYRQMSLSYWMKESNAYSAENFQKESRRIFGRKFRQLLSNYDKRSKFSEIDKLSITLNYYLASSMNLYLISGEFRYLDEMLSDLLDSQDADLFVGKKSRRDYITELLFDVCLECNGAFSLSPIYHEPFPLLLSESYRKDKSLWLAIPLILSQNQQSNFSVSSDYFIKIMRADSLAGGFLYANNIDENGHSIGPLSPKTIDQMYDTGYVANLVKHGVCNVRDAVFLWPYTLNRVPNAESIVSVEVLEQSKSIFFNSDIRLIRSQMIGE